MAEKQKSKSEDRRVGVGAWLSPAAAGSAAAQESCTPSLKFGSILILALTLLVYLSSLRGGFIWDDDIMLTENRAIKANASEALFTFWCSSKQPDYLPLTSTSLWLEWRLWGMNAMGYRLTNILLHGFSAILLWRILRRLKIAGAFVAAMIFAVHPVCVASVAWIAERKNTLSMIFFLLSIFCWVRSEEPDSASQKQTQKWYWLSFGSFVLALFSKGSVVILPCVLLLLAWWQRGQIDRRDILKSASYFAAALVFGLITIWFQFHRSSGEQVIDQLGFLSKALAASKAVCFYFLKALWPVNLSMIYPQWKIETKALSAYIPLFLLIGAFVLFWCYRRSWGRSALFAAAYFILALLPVLGFIDMYFLTYSRVADHWQYLAIIGVIVLAVSSAAQVLNLALNHNPNLVSASDEEGKSKIRITIKSRKRFGSALAVGVILALGVCAWQRAAIIVDSETLWRDTLTKNPAAWVAHTHLGNIVSNQGKLDEAAAHFSEALALKPDFADAHFNLANTLAAQGEIAKATSHFLEAIRFKPRYPEAHYNLGLALERQGKTDEALIHYQETTRINPAHSGAHNNVGNLLSQQGKDEEAISHYEQALQLSPNLPEAHNNLANVLQRQGKIEEAIPHYLQAIALKPDYADAHNNLAVGLDKLGRSEEAQAHRREAAQLKK